MRAKIESMTRRIFRPGLVETNETVTEEEIRSESQGLFDQDPLVQIIETEMSVAQSQDTKRRDMMLELLREYNAVVEIVEDPRVVQALRDLDKKAQSLFNSAKNQNVMRFSQLDFHSFHDSNYPVKNLKTLEEKVAMMDREIIQVTQSYMAGKSVEGFSGLGQPHFGISLYGKRDAKTHAPVIRYVDEFSLITSREFKNVDDLVNALRRTLQCEPKLWAKDYQKWSAKIETLIPEAVNAFKTLYKMQTGKAINFFDYYTYVDLKKSGKFDQIMLLLDEVNMRYRQDLFLQSIASNTGFNSLSSVRMEQSLTSLRHSSNDQSSQLSSILEQLKRIK